MEEILEKQGREGGERNENGETAIHIAAMEGKVVLLRLVLLVVLLGVVGYGAGNDS